VKFSPKFSHRCDFRLHYAVLILVRPVKLWNFQKINPQRRSPMMLTMLLEQLKSPLPELRIQALCALTMLEETGVLERLAYLRSGETHPEVREAIAWAETQIRQAQARGYRTETAMAQAFRSGLYTDTTEQQRLLAQVGGETGRPDSRSGPASILRVLRIGFFGAAGGTAASRRIISKGGALPPRPTASDVSHCLSRLNDPDPAARAVTIVQLQALNNPAALGALAQQFVNDPDPGVRCLAQHAGKLIYFSALYWEERDAKEAARRRRQAAQNEVEPAEAQRVSPVTARTATSDSR
jgi:hypothetical protein